MISFLRAECDNFEEDYDNEEVYDSIKDCFLKLQKALEEELDSIAVNGLINHINQGGMPPNANYVKALQKRWKAFAEHKNVRECGIQPVMGEDCHVVKYDRTRIFLSFKLDSEESFTGYQLNPDQSLNHDKN